MSCHSWKPDRRNAHFGGDAGWGSQPGSVNNGYHLKMELCRFQKQRSDLWECCKHRDVSASGAAPVQGQEHQETRSLVWKCWGRGLGLASPPHSPWCTRAQLRELDQWCCVGDSDALPQMIRNVSPTPANSPSVQGLVWLRMYEFRLLAASCTPGPLLGVARPLSLVS